MIKRSSITVATAKRSTKRLARTLWTIVELPVYLAAATAAIAIYIIFAH